MLHQHENKFPQFNFSDDEDNQSEEEMDTTIVIGYYNLRGKAQVPRLLCEYLHIDYRDELMSLTEWDRYKRTQTKKWDYNDLPFLKEGDFVVSQPTPICIYLIKRFGSLDLLGKTLQDKSLVMMYVWTIQTMGNIVNINCQKKTPQELLELKRNQWKNNVAPRLQKYEQIAKQDDWFMGYFTLIDLSMYELVRYMELIFPGEVASFPRIKAIEQRVSKIPEIRNYEQSQRAITQTDPTTLLEELKRNRMNAMQAQQAQQPQAQQNTETVKVTNASDTARIETQKNRISPECSHKNNSPRNTKGTMNSTRNSSENNVSLPLKQSNTIPTSAGLLNMPYNTKTTMLVEEKVSSKQICQSVEENN